MTSEQTLDAAVRVEVYRSFIDQGLPPVPAELAEAVATDQALVEGSLRRLDEAHVLVLAPGTPYIWMAPPLSAIPTPFRVEIGGRGFFGTASGTRSGSFRCWAGAERLRRGVRTAMSRCRSRSLRTAWLREKA
jgi:hypothetical protein